MKKVLMILYCFPPMAVVGVYRAIKFVKYLRHYGWEPIVLTLKSPRDHAYNPELFKDIPDDVKVYRTSNFEPLVLWESFNQRRKGQQKPYQVEETKNTDGPSGQNKSGGKSVWGKVRGLIAATLSTPDKSTGWLLFALPKALSIIKKEKIDCIYTSTPPHSGHLIGYLAKRISGVPFIADFRAPWTQNEYFDDYKNLRFFKNIEEKMELAVHRSADAVISNSTYEGEGYHAKYAPIVGDKFHPILNGYDPDDFSINNCKKYDKFTIVYIGSLYGRRNPDLFLEGVRNFLNKNPEAKEDFKLLFIGIEATSLNSVTKSFNLDGVAESVGFLPQSQAYNYLFGANLLLMILGFDQRGKGVIPAKLFEYLPTGRPILALIPEGETAKIIRNNDAGTVITKHDVSLVENAIAGYYSEYKQNRNIEIEPEVKIFKEYTRKYQTGQLAELLNTAVKKND